MRIRRRGRPIESVLAREANRIHLEPTSAGLIGFVIGGVMTDTIARLPKNSQDEIVVSLSDFKGHYLVDIRTHSKFSDADEARPTKKGVALNVHKLPALTRALQEAEVEARRRGLIRE